MSSKILVQRCDSPFKIFNIGPNNFYMLRSEYEYITSPNVAVFLVFKNEHKLINKLQKYFKCEVSIITSNASANFVIKDNDNDELIETNNEDFYTIPNIFILTKQFMMYDLINRLSSNVEFTNNMQNNAREFLFTSLKLPNLPIFTSSEQTVNINNDQSNHILLFNDIIIRLHNIAQNIIINDNVSQELVIVVEKIFNITFNNCNITKLTIFRRCPKGYDIMLTALNVTHGTIISDINSTHRNIIIRNDADLHNNDNQLRLYLQLPIINVQYDLVAESLTASDIVLTLLQIPNSLHLTNCTLKCNEIIMSDSLIICGPLSFFDTTRINPNISTLKVINKDDNRKQAITSKLTTLDISHIINATPVQNISINLRHNKIASVTANNQELKIETINAIDKNILDITDNLLPDKYISNNLLPKDNIIIDDLFIDTSLIIEFGEYKTLFIKNKLNGIKLNGVTIDHIIFDTNFTCDIITITNCKINNMSIQPHANYDANNINYDNLTYQQLNCRRFNFENNDISTKQMHNIEVNIELQILHLTNRNINGTIQNTLNKDNLTAILQNTKLSHLLLQNVILNPNVDISNIKTAILNTVIAPNLKLGDKVKINNCVLNQIN